MRLFPQTIHRWHHTRLGYGVFLLAEVGIVYGLTSLAIVQGNFLWYLLILIFLIGILQNLYRLIEAFIRGK